MGAITTILAKNLPPAAQVRIGAAQTYLDTPAGFSIRLSKDVERLSDLNKIKVEGALRTNLDFTPTNDAVLIEYYTPLTVDRRGRWIDVSVFVEGLPTQFARMYVIRKDEGRRQWEVEFALPADHWAELATQKKINTIDFGGATLTHDNVLTSWDAPTYSGDYAPEQDVNGWNAAIAWWPVDYGDWVDRSIPDQNTIKPVKMIATEDMRPHVNMMYLLKRGFCEIGWTIDGLIMEHPWSRSLWAYWLREQYYTGKGYDGVEYGKTCRVIGRIITGLGVPVTTLAPSNPYAYFEVLDYIGSPGNELELQGGPDKWMCGIKNPLPFKARFRFSFKMTLEYIQVIGLVPYDVIFRMSELSASNDDNDEWTGEILSDDVQFVLEPLESKFVAFDFDVELEPGQKCALQFDGNFAAYIKPGMWFRCEPANEAFTRGDNVDVRTALDTESTLLDGLKAYAQMINGRFETNYTSRTISIYPDKTSDVYGSAIPGFVRDDLESEDITQSVDPRSVQMRFIRPDLKRYTRFSFADSEDSYIEELAIVEPLHSRKINNGEDLPDEIDERQNPVFEPTAEGQSDLLKQNDFTIVNRPNAPVPYLPRYWDNRDGNRSFNIGPRILFAFGMIKQVNPSPLATTDQYANFYFDEYVNATEEFGYATQLRTWELDPAPTLDGSVVFGRVASDLFVNFYMGITTDNRGGVEVDLLQMMSMADYARYNFRRMFTLNYEGRSLRMPMTAIRDFTPGIPTPVTYFAQPVETTCCDLPCSCRFRTCDYYQDFGEFIQQSTMDDLLVTSFKVDDRQLLSAPVPLGQLNIIDLGGGPYVTNLVDTLNSIGAPYFAFGYSTRVHAQKGMRFFTIKHPACQGFEIIISDIADPVYRYTHDAQQEQWFAGSWGAIGYGGETFTAPDNCETTIEY